MSADWQGRTRLTGCHASECRIDPEILKPLLESADRTSAAGRDAPARPAKDDRRNTHGRSSSRPEAHAAEAERELTDGFHLIIDALKLNGLTTIYGVPGIPITDFGRMAQAAGIRVLSFRHEQNAGNAAAIAGFLTKKPGVCLTVSAPGFLNGLTALAHATTNCFPMILISGSSEREIVDLQQGDYEEMDQLAIAKPLCKAAFRVLHAARHRHRRSRARFAPRFPDVRAASISTCRPSCSAR